MELCGLKNNAQIVLAQFHACGSSWLQIQTLNLEFWSWVFHAATLSYSHAIDEDFDMHVDAVVREY